MKFCSHFILTSFPWGNFGLTIHNSIWLPSFFDFIFFLITLSYACLFLELMTKSFSQFVLAEEVDKMSLVDWLLKFTGAQTVIIFTFEIFWCFNLRIQLILLDAMIEWPKTSWNGWLNKERLRISDRHCLNNYYFFLLIKLLRLKIKRENDFFFYKWNCFFFFVEDN